MIKWGIKAPSLLYRLLSSSIHISFKIRKIKKNKDGINFALT